MTLPVLGAFAEEELETEADAKNRLPGIIGLAHRLEEAQFAQIPHRAPERPDAGQDDTIGSEDFGTVGDDRRALAETVKGANGPREM